MSQEHDDTPAAPTGAPAGEEADFARMLESSLTARSFQEGETVEAVVVALWPDVAFLDVGGKSEMTIDIGELKDAEGDLEVEVGDRIQATVVSTESGLRLSRKMARGAAARQQLADAYRAGLPVEGKVEKVIKGGFEVRIAGLRAFCPASQIDDVRGADPAAHAGRVYTFRITEYTEGGKNLVVSRRALLEEENRERAEEVRGSIEVGAVVSGRVVSVRDFGAFVDLGAGVQGLLHVSEMRWSRVASPAEIVQPGDTLTVKVLRVEGNKIALGLKQLQPDPWSKAAEAYAPGQVREGRVTRVADFGAFVELEPGIEALAHLSTFPPTGKPGGWRDAVRPGSVGQFEILSVDPAQKRIGVARVEADSTRDRGPAGGELGVGARLRGKVERHERFGVFVFLAPGRTGLMPVDETGFPRGTDLRKTFPVGSEVEVLVQEVDPAGRRIRVSRRAALEAEEKAEARTYADAQERQISGSFGSLADKLRSALGGSGSDGTPDGA